MQKPFARPLLIVSLAALGSLASVALPAVAGGASPSPRPSPPPVVPHALAPPPAPRASPLPAVLHVPATLHVSAASPAAKAPAAAAAASPVVKRSQGLHAAPPVGRFAASRVAAGDALKLRTLISGGAHASAAGAPAAHADASIVENVHMLMPGGPDAYDQVLVTPEHVALVRKSGIIDLMSHADAKTQIQSGKPFESKKVQVGLGPRGFPLYGEEGPNGSVRVYRQLPRAAKGEVSANQPFTSFALTEEDAFHPYGEAGPTVTITVPRDLLARIETGELGGLGWMGKGGMAIDVLGEVQIDTRVLKAHLAGNWRDAVAK